MGCCTRIKDIKRSKQLKAAAAKKATAEATRKANAAVKSGKKIPPRKVPAKKVTPCRHCGRT
jgi:hypothetical protein